MRANRKDKGHLLSILRLLTSVIVLVAAIHILPAHAAVPGAPTIGRTSAGSGQVEVNFTAPASDGGSAITAYTVTASPGGLTSTDIVSPITITGLTNGTVYTFSVTATNDDGTGPPSAASNFTTPRLYAPTTGTINNLVVFIRFSDQSEFIQPLSYYDNIFNSASNSLKNFYLENSYNTLTVNSTFYPSPNGSSVVSYQDSHPTSYYQPYNATTNPLGYQGGQSTARETALVTNALNAISAQIPGGLNLDGDGDGYIDHITFEVCSTNLHPLPVLFYSRATYDTSGGIVINGKKVGSYTWVTATQDSSYPANAFASTEIHEMGHSFGYPDLRNNSTRYPVGNWDVMSLDTPVHSGAYMKSRFTKWISGSIPEITAYGTYTLNDITQSLKNSYKIKIPNKSEYLVLEYRKAAGPFESNLPGSGLCITRINEAAGMWGNSSGNPFYIYYFHPNGTLSSDGSSNNMFQCLNAESGHAQFNDFSNPACFLSDGSPCGISIDNIGTASGTSITFSVGDPNTVIVTHLISGYLSNGGSRVSGAIVTLSGDASDVVTTDSLGRYMFTVDAGGNYTITPTKANMTFSPVSKAFTNLISDQTQNFTGTKITNTITGKITSGGVAVNGATVAINCPAGGNYVGSVTSNATGNYSFVVDAGSTCSVWAIKTSYMFSPNSKTFTNITANQVQDFTDTNNTVPDTIIPIVSAFTAPLQANSLTIPVTTLTATDNTAVTGYLITESSTKPLASTTGWSASAPSSYTTTSVGAKTLYAWAKDAAGNVSAAKTAAVTIDMTTPVVTVFTAPAATTSLTIKVAITATDNVGVGAYLITESATAPAASDPTWSAAKLTGYTFASNTADGSKSIYAWVKDKAGNVSAAKSASVTIAVPPVVSAFTVPALIASRTISPITITATDNVNVTGYLITTTSTAPLATATGWSATAPASFDVTTDGAKTLYAWAKDAAGNVSLDRKAMATADTTLPTVKTFTMPLAINSLTVPINLTVADNVAVGAYLVTESATAPLASDTNWKTTKPTSFVFAANISDGSQTLYVWAKDTVGNVSLAKSATVTIDRITPVISAFSVPSITNSLTVPVTTFTAADNTVVAGYKLTETSAAPLATASGWSATKPVSCKVSAAGTKTLYAWVKDSAGNVSVSASATVIIDLTKPVVSAFAIPTTATNLTVPVTAFTASDNAAVTGYLITLTSTAPLATATGWTANSPNSYSVSSTGTKKLYAWAKDAAGNVSLARYATVIVQ